MHALSFKFDMKGEELHHGIEFMLSKITLNMFFSMSSTE